MSLARNPPHGSGGWLGSNVRDFERTRRGSWDATPPTDFAAWDRQADLNPDKGTVYTEAGAR